MKQVVRIILAAAAVAVMAVPAMSAEKLIVKNAGGTSNMFVATDDGKLGIGGSPVNVLDVYKEWAGVDAGNLVTAISVYKDQARYTWRRANGTPAVPTALGNGDAIGNLNFRGHDGTNWSSAAVAAIVVSAEETFTPTAQGTRLIFMTNTKGTAPNPIERLRISSSGSVIAANRGGGAAVTPLAVTDTDGHLYIPTVAGAVTSCATMTVVNTGHAPIWIDSTNAKVCSCLSGALKCASLL